MQDLPAASQQTRPDQATCSCLSWAAQRFSGARISMNGGLLPASLQMNGIQTKIVHGHCSVAHVTRNKETVAKSAADDSKERNVYCWCTISCC